MPKYLLLCLLFCGFISCNSSINHNDLHLTPDNNFPQWLSYNGYSTSQTSGITYLSTDSAGNKIFLLADDVGKLHHLKVTDDNISSITPIYFSPDVEKFFTEFPKVDIEEVLYDKKKDVVYISIEGNGKNYQNFASIFRLSFARNDIFADTIQAVEKMQMTPQKLFSKYLDMNIGYEGLAADDNYFYLGLEGFSTKGMFADSTVIFIVDKTSLKIVKQINTKQFGIHTICGLSADGNYSLYGIDRNNKKIFHLIFNNELNVERCDTAAVKTNIPNYKSFNYVASLESITMDDEKNIYMIDDPWTT
ncbi:MAG TPA: hypothetical protein VLB84_13590, partial [Bacteroidia bacterium]|nr:hypothetical protein [Bacteroidia bacterium]